MDVNERDGRHRQKRRRNNSSSSSSSSSSSNERSRDRKKKKKKKSKKHRRCSSSSTERSRSSSSSSSSSRDRSYHKKKKKLKKQKKKEEKKKKKQLKKQKNKESKKGGNVPQVSSPNIKTVVQPSIPQPLPNVVKHNVFNEETKQKPPTRRPMVPMTKEEYEKQQSIVRRVYDPETGRNRLIKGDGEVMEEIVSKTRHKEINKMSTQADGEYFAASIGIGKK